MMQSGYNIKDLVQEAQTRWLKPAEVLFILQNYENHQLTDKPPQKPASGFVFLFNKRVLRFFRKDGHTWRRKKDGRTVGEAHERLKVGNVEALNCYYARGEQNPNFQRRSYWMLDPAYEHIVFVHYRDVTEVKHSAGSSSQLSPGSCSNLTLSPRSYKTQLPVSTSVLSEIYEPNQNIFSPSSVEVSSDVVIKSHTMNNLGIQTTGEVNSSSDLEVSQALRRLEEQLSLNDDGIEETGVFYSENENSNDSLYISPVHSGSKSAEIQDYSSNLALQQDPGDIYGQYQPLEDGFTRENEDSSTWKEVLDYHESSSGVASLEKHRASKGMLELSSRRELVEEQENNIWLNFDEDNTMLQNSHNSFASPAYMLLPQEVEDFKFPAYSPAVNIYETVPNYSTSLFDQVRVEVPVEANWSLTISEKQRFTIREISPEWGYASESTKVIIIGSFKCDPSDFSWTCMFGDTEVPLEILQEGVVCCQSPPQLPGKVSLCITTGNRESCSEVREFEYRVNPCGHSNLLELEASRSAEELLLLFRFVQMLLSDSSNRNGDNFESGVDVLGNNNAGEDSWSQAIESVLTGAWTSSSTTDWLLQELLKDKLQQWLSSRSVGGSVQSGFSMSKKEQGIIHMVAGLGFGWALNPILNSGVGVNFRDLNGCTALHWAARFGREKMVAELIASGAAAGAVTDPSKQDPTGKTPASIAASCGHKGLAGYLSEVALTSHLSSLTLEESELSKSSAHVEAERTVNSISKTSLVTNEDQLSLEDTLAAVRNAAQAAARIQSAFRAHSFRRRKEREIATSLATSASGDEYNILSNDIQGLSAASKLAFRNTRDYSTAALSIQKKYRGWKGRKNFLAFRQKVVKIQAHVRGYQVRVNYKVCWATSVLEKVILRWRRRGIGLRGFRPESEFIDESEDEDVLKVIRKQKVDVAIDEAVKRVLSMVESQEARQQYHRILEKYRQAKAELDGPSSEAISVSQGDMFSMEDGDIYQLCR